MNKIFKKSLFISSILVLLSTSFCFADINVSRISGSNRYETAINVSKNNFIKADYVIIASGENYPDAIMGGALSTQTQSPILLVKKITYHLKLSTKLKEFLLITFLHLEEMQLFLTIRCLI